VPERVTEEVEEDAARDWLELESKFELDVDASGLDVVDIETDDNWEVEELLELDTLLEMEDRTVELDKDDEVDIFELEEMAVAVVELDAFDIVVPLPEGGAIA
jgi:hypothetical protein